jgi:gliding motility-associated-like protein
MKEQDKYNKLIQDKLDGFEFEYNPADWSSLAKQLPKKGIAPFYKVASIFVGAAVIAFSAYYFTSNTATNQTTSEEIVISESNQPNTNESDNITSIEKIESKENSTAEVSAPIKNQNTEQETKKQKLTAKKAEKDNATEKVISKKQLPVEEEKVILSDQKSPLNELILNQTTYCIDAIIVFETKSPLSKNQVIKVNGAAIKGNEFIADSEGEYSLALYEEGKRIDAKAFTISSPSKSSFVAAKKSEEFAKISYNFESASNDEINYTWSINGIEVANKSSFNNTFSRADKINVSLATTNSNGCKSTTTKTIQIEEDFDIYSYDAFTPNGDGINDEFIPKAIEANNLRFEMMIYSLSGQLLYSTTDFNKPWNGRRNNDGEMMTNGTYLWKVNLFDDNNDAHPFNGQIKIVNLK